MEFVAGLFFFLLGLSAIIGTFKKPKNDDEAKKLEIFKKHKWKYRIGGYFLMSIGFALMFPDAFQSSNTSQSTVEISNQQQPTKETTVQTSNQQQQKIEETVEISEKNLKQTVASFYNEKYPEATIYGENNEAIIYFPSKKSPPPATDFVGFMKYYSGFYLVVYCDFGDPGKRSLNSKECLSDKDKEGRSIIDAFYYIYNIEKPSETEFIDYIRQKCMESECYINDMPVIASDNKKYMLNIRSYYISPKNKHIQYVYIDISPAQ